jgi:hypothetical protein
LRDVTHDNFGFLIAYVVPGVIVVWGVSYVSPTVAGWFAAGTTDAATIGGFLYVTIASVAAGMFVSAIRWLVIDTLHHRTGVPKPAWDFARLQDNLAAFQTVVEHQYRHYQFYSNSLVSLAFLYGVRRVALESDLRQIVAETAAFAAVGTMFFVASRDNLHRYYERTNAMLASAAPRRRRRSDRRSRAK